MTPVRRYLPALATLLLILFFLPVLPTAAQTHVLTYHNDNARTGQDVTEVILTPGNVNSTNFGKLGFLSVDGLVDAEPLYVSNLTVAGNQRNVVFVVTEHDSVYAFDAGTFAQLWKVTVLGSGETTSDNRGCNQVSPEIGITSTPVIDLNAGPHGTVFVVAMSKDNFGNYHQRLHALDLTTGAELSGSPTTIQASFPNATGQVTFDPKQYKERAALLLLNGVIYTTWASHCDITPYTGWVIGYSESTLQQVSVFNFTPNGSDGSVWMSGAGPAADSLGNIYFLAANGTFDTTLSANGFPVNGDYGNAFIKLSTSGNLGATDYFTMHNTVAESNVDQDLGSGGALLLPDLTDSLGNTRHLAVGAGKDAIIYVVNRDSMGKFNPSSDNIYQEISANGLSGGSGVYGMPAYFNGTLYYGAVNDSLKAFTITSAQLVTPPSSKTASAFAYPGTTPSISANGTANGIVWAVRNNGGTGILEAYDATNLANELYNSNQAGTRDQFSDNKFITPMIANGKVYVGTPTAVVVFGLLSGGTPPPPPSGTVTLQNANSNLCIDTGGSAGFTALIQSPCSTSNTQKFTLTAAPASGWYYLVSAASNLCWDVAGGSGSAGALIQQYTCVAVSPEYYQLKAVSGGYEILSANMTNGCLDVVGASTASGAHIEQNTCTGSANQIFNTGAPSNTAPTITTQPGNQTVTAGQTAAFTAAATGSPTPTVQWQVSTSGGAFSNVSGATSTTLSFATASSQNGNQYQAVFTNSAGSATTTAATLTVNSPTPPTITTQPANQTASAGQTATFTAAATGSPTPTVQWQVSTDGGATFSNVSGATSTALSFTTALSQNANQYRAVFTNSAGMATTTAATLTVNNSPTPPTITTQPANQTVTTGQTATFMAAATGSPTPTVQWQASTNGGTTFSNVSGATSTTLSFTTTLSQNGNQYRAVFSNSAGSANTTAARLTVNAASPPSGTVTLQNTNSNLCIDTGGSAGFTALIQSPCSTSNTQKFTLTAAPASGWYYLVSAASNLCWDVAGGSGSAGALIQQYSCVAVWPEYYQLKAVSGGYEILSGNMSNGCLDVVGTSMASGAHIEQNTCTGSANQVFNIVTPSNTPTITTQPASQTVTAGQTATFTAAASGSPTPTVQWQVSTDSGTTFSNVSGATSTTLSFMTVLSQNGSQYRAVFTNSAGTATTTAATLTVNNSPTLPTITTQPANQTVTAGQTATFTAAASGSPTPTVQWQVSTDGGVTFSNVSGATSTTLSFTAASSQNGNQYRAVFTNTAGTATTTAPTLTVNAAPPPSGTGAAQLITPAPGASGVDPFQAFTWNSVPGAQVYYIYVGTSPGQTDIYNSGEIAPTITSRTVLGLIGSQTYYVTLWTKINNTWYSVPSSFSTASQPLPSDANTFRSTVQQLTGNVRLMTQGATNSPIPGTLLAQVVAEDGVPIASCEQYSEALARLLAGQRISARIRNTFFDGTNYEAHVIAEYYDPFLNKWIVADATFGVVYWNPGTTSGMSIDDISSAVAAKNWSSIQPFITYATSNGQLYSHNYYMDPILLFLNPSTSGVQVAQLPLANSPVPFFTVHADTDIGKSGTWLFSFVNQTDMVTISGGSQYGPLVGTIYSRSIALNTGWSITSRPSGMQILTMNRYLYP